MWAIWVLALLRHPATDRSRRRRRGRVLPAREEAFHGQALHGLSPRGGFPSALPRGEARAPAVGLGTLTCSESAKPPCMSRDTSITDVIDSSRQPALDTQRLAAALSGSSPICSAHVAVRKNIARVRPRLKARLSRELSCGFPVGCPVVVPRFVWRLSRGCSVGNADRNANRDADRNSIEIRIEMQFE